MNFPYLANNKVGLNSEQIQTRICNFVIQFVHYYIQGGMIEKDTGILMLIIYSVVTNNKIFDQATDHYIFIIKIRLMTISVKII